MTILFNFRILLLFIVYLLCDSLITEKSGYFGTWIFFCKKSSTFSNKTLDYYRVIRYNKENKEMDNVLEVKK
nr:MAG TPA: hypothetical protein [Caudoviricetes sp.]